MKNRQEQADARRRAHVARFRDRWEEYYRHEDEEAELSPVKSVVAYKATAVAGLTLAGAWYLLRLIPYTTQWLVIGGVAILIVGGAGLRLARRRRLVLGV